MSNLKYTFEMLQQEALKYKSRGEFQRLSTKYYRSAHGKRVLDQICLHMPKHVSMVGTNNPTFKWTLEKLQQEALRYNTRKEFLKNNRSAYFTAQTKDVLNTICSHMKRLVREDWTFEELQKEASKYKSRSEFSKNSPGAYKSARKKNNLERICKHMKKSCGVSFQEQDLFNVVKSFYPKTQKFRDRKVKIENKPHIQGFDLDIYVPELRKGIEFDGNYHHSIEGMKRSRSWWPEEDLVNYHKIKDDFFASKNINVFHIKEKEWIKNRQSCIDKCLEFLRQ